MFMWPKSSIILPFMVIRLCFLEFLINVNSLMFLEHPCIKGVWFLSLCPSPKSNSLVLLLYCVYVFCLSQTRSKPNYTSKIALIHPSFSGLFVTCAYLPILHSFLSLLPHTTFPDSVTNPNSLTFTSMIVPFVITPSSVYNLLCGFFFTPIMSR